MVTVFCLPSSGLFDNLGVADVVQVRKILRKVAARQGRGEAGVVPEVKGEWVSGVNTGAETERQRINLRIALLLDRALVGLLLVFHLNVAQHFQPTDNLRECDLGEDKEVRPGRGT
jgi:hypothetical protein